MPDLQQTIRCSVCGLGKPVPAKARFCRNCGRSFPASRTSPATPAGGSGVLVGAIVIVCIVIALVGLILLRVQRPAVVVAQPATPPVHHRTFTGPPPSTVTVTPPPTGKPRTEVSPPKRRQTIPRRPGDTELFAEPPALYMGGPSADHLTVGGLRIGLPVSEIPREKLAESLPDHLRTVAGDLCAVDDGRIREIHVRDPDLVARWPIDSTNALFARFGEPTDIYTDDGNGAFPTFLYPARGIHVRWDQAAGRIIEIVLVPPTSGGNHAPNGR